MTPVTEKLAAIEADLFAPKMEVNVESLVRPYEPQPITPRLPEPYVKHTPDEGGPQEAFLLDQRKELLYGGSAGGGKSDALLMAGLQYVDVPGYAAIIFRKTYTDLSLEGALMERAHEWLGDTDAKWNESKKKWRFPKGSSLSFGYLASSLDKYRYQSAEFQYIAFDELTQFPETDYRYLFSRLRRLAGSSIPIRMRAASNPGGIGHRWVKARFRIEGSTSRKIEVSKDRAFYPAKLADNRFVDRASYREQLSELDEHTRMQLEEGDWDARQPGPWVLDHMALDEAFEAGDQMQKDGLPPPVGEMLPLGMDFGETSHILVGWPLEHNGMAVVNEYVYRRGEPDTQAKSFYDEVFKAYKMPLGRQRFDASKPESMRLWLRGMGDLGVLDHELARGKPSPIPFNKFKRYTILHLRKMLENTSQGKLGKLVILGSRCPELREQLYDWQFKNEDTEDVKKENDHGPDAMVALCAPLAPRRTKG